MRIRKLFFIFVLMAVSQLNLMSQGFELGGWLGISNYFGELNPTFNISKPGLAGGANLRVLFNDRISLKSTISLTRFGANDKNSTNSFDKKRNLSFRSIIVDFNNQIEFNFLPYVHGSSDYFTPYLAGGFNVFYYDPKAEYKGKYYSLRELGTEGQALGEEYFQFSAGLTFGGGLKWDISTKLSMNLEMSYRFTFTDYLDDVSKTYPNVRELQSLRGDIAVKLSDRSNIPGFAVQGKQRGNSRDNDRFSFIQLSMMYYFGSLKCPTINRYD